MTPAATNTPSPIPTPIPTAREVAAAQLSKIITWFVNPPDSIHSYAAETITGIWLQDSELGVAVARLPWVKDDIAETDLSSLNALAGIAKLDSEPAMLVVSSDWFADGVDYDDPYGSEESVLRSLRDIAEESSEMVTLVLELPWIADDMTVYESSAIRYLAGLARADLDLSVTAAGSPWVTDGIVWHETFALNDLLYMTPWNSELAWQVIGYSLGTPVRNRDVYLISDLYRLHESQPEQFEHLISQPWFADGLDPEERAFIISLDAPDSRWFNDLLETRITQSAEISLPFAGEVNLWAFQHAPFPPNEDLLTNMEKAVRGTERLMGVPFPINDVIALLLPEAKYLGGFAASYQDDHIRIARSGESLVVSSTVYHEVAHYYFSDKIGPHWLVEGGADFIAAYIKDWLGVESLEDQLVRSAANAQHSCVEHGLENIHKLSAPNPPEPLRWQGCNYLLGRHFLISLFETLGEKAMSSALRELYLRSEHDDPRPTEEEVYRAFLTHTPSGLEEEFWDLYRRLHGGPFVDAEG